MRNNNLGLIGFLSLTVLFAAGCSTTQGTAKLKQSWAPASSPAIPAQPAATEAAITAAEPAAPATTETVASPAEAAPAAPGTTATADAAPAAAQASAPAAAPTPSEVQIAAKLLPLPPEDVINTVKKLTKHPRVLYMSSKAQYNYYVGGQFNAEYSPAKQVFTISNDTRQDKPVTCQYGKDGELLDKKKTDPDMVNRCGELVHSLSDFLSN